MKKITLLILVMLLSVMGVNAKRRTTTLWEGSSTGNIEIEYSSLVSGATITVYTTVKSSDTADDRKLRIFYTAAGDGWVQTSFSDVNDWVELTEGQESHSFTLTSSVYEILGNDNKSHKILYIGANNAKYVTITKITMTETLTPSSTGENLLTGNWSSSKTDAKIFSAQSGAKIGDVLQFTVTTEETWKWVQFKLTDKDGKVDQFTGDGSEPQGNNANTSFTLEFVISTVADLLKIQTEGFGVIQTGDNAFTLTAVNLLSYSDSYSVEAVTMGSYGVMTYSNTNNLDFSDTGLTPYYASSATVGTVTLTAVDDKTTWNYQGYILKGDKGTYYPKVIDSNSGTYPNNNLLKGNTGQSTVYRSAYSDYTGTEDNATNIKNCYRYIFAIKTSGDSTPAFYKLTSDHTLDAHKAYLETANDITPTAARVALVFSDDETTGIESMDNGKRTMDNGQCFDLQGRRVAQPQKGLYIVNGRKVVIK